MASSFNVNSYCRNQPELRLFPAPVIAKRAPLTSDRNFPIGQIWIEPANASNVAVNGAWVLTSIISNVANWAAISGGSGSFTSLSVSGNITSTAGNIAATAGTVTGGTGLIATTGGVTATAGNITATNGNLVLGTAGNKLSIATGANASMGTSAAMTAGTITISTTAVTASSKIFLSANTPGGTQGVLSAPTASIIAGTSFVINSSNAADTSTVNWLIIN